MHWGSAAGRTLYLKSFSTGDLERINNTTVSSEKYVFEHLILMQTRYKFYHRYFSYRRNESSYILVIHSIIGSFIHFH